MLTQPHTAFSFLPIHQLRVARQFSQRMCRAFKKYNKPAALTNNHPQRCFVSGLEHRAQLLYVSEAHENGVLANAVDSTWEGNQEGIPMSLDFVMPKSMVLL